MIMSTTIPEWTLTLQQTWTLPVTYPNEVEEIIRIPIEIEPLEEIPLDYEVPRFDEPKPQPQPLRNCPSLDVSLGDERGPEPPIKPHTLDSFRMKRQMRGSEYGEQDRKAAIWYEYETFKATEGEQLLDTYLRYLQVINDLKKCGYKKDNCDVNDALGYKKKAVVQNQGDVNDAIGSKKKTIVVTSDPLALIAEKTKVSKNKEKVVISSDSERSEVDDFTELKKITALLAKAFNRRKFYSKPTNNNLRTSSSS
nr:hypothetical protein [Tanacetum cinerariifolium]